MENLMPESSGPANNEEIKKILLDNQQLLLEIKEQTQKTKKYILTGRVVSIIYLLLIIVPLFFAAFYLPPLMKDIIQPYQELLGQPQNGDGLDTSSIDDLWNQLQQK